MSDKNMGMKGPIIILVMGFAGLIGLGVMANMMLKDPRAQSILEFRDAFAAEFEIEKAQLKPRLNTCTLTVWVDGERFRPAAGQELPPDFAGLKDFFREHYEGPRPPRTLQVEFRDGDRVISKHRLDMKEGQSKVRAELEALLGKEMRVTQRSGRALVVYTKRELDTASLEKVAQLLKNYQRGGWKRITVNVAGKSHRFDGDGKPQTK